MVGSAVQYSPRAATLIPKRSCLNEAEPLRDLGRFADAPASRQVGVLMRPSAATQRVATGYRVCERVGIGPEVSENVKGDRAPAYYGAQDVLGPDRRRSKSLTFVGHPATDRRRVLRIPKQLALDGLLASTNDAHGSSANAI